MRNIYNTYIKTCSCGETNLWSERIAEIKPYTDLRKILVYYKEEYRDIMKNLIDDIDEYYSGKIKNHEKNML